MVNLGLGIFFFSKSPKVGRFLIFHAKLQFLGGLDQGSRSVAIMATLGEAITTIMRSRAAIILAIISFCWQLWSQIMRTAWQLWEKIYSFRVQLQELADNYRVQLSENLPNYEKHFTITEYDKGKVFYSSTTWLRLWK